MKYIKRTGALSAAACALLGTAGPAAAAEAKWDIDTATMVYSESDRVTAVEPVISARRSWGEKSLGAKLTLDTLTGASPSGATPASAVQTFTGASGKGDIYTAQPGEVPLDDAFKDTRIAIALDYEMPLGRDWTVDYGINGSGEYDYLSLGTSLRLQRDFNQKNTTLSLGASFAQDTIEPVGKVPQALTVFQIRGPAGSGNEDDGEDRSLRDSDDSKTLVDLLVGVTQVIDPLSLFRVNLVFSQSSGYLTDPYKVVSIVDANGEPLRYLREGRPDSRTKTGIYGEYLRAFGENTFKSAYRFLLDDWGSDSQTLELSYRWRINGRNYLEPQLRYYLQDSADFYRVALFDGEEVGLSEITADYRLGRMDAITFGAQYGHTLQNGSDLTFRIGYYVQTPDEEGIPVQAAAGLAKFGEIVPETTAILASVGYRFTW